MKFCVGFLNWLILSAKLLTLGLHKAFVVVTEDEKFVLVIGGMEQDNQIFDKLIVFTEKNAFLKLTQF